MLAEARPRFLPGIDPGSKQYSGISPTLTIFIPMFFGFVKVFRGASSDSSIFIQSWLASAPCISNQHIPRFGGDRDVVVNHTLVPQWPDNNVL
jgi:hypothetical protein